MRKQQKNVCWPICWLLVLLLLSVAEAQSDSAGGSAIKAESDAAAKRKMALEEFLKDAQIYEITLEAAKPITLKLLPQPVFNWDGSTFVWLYEGQPEVIASFWTNIEPRTGRIRHPHALHSLSEHPIVARFRSKLVWNPQEPGLKFQPIPQAEAPSDKSWRRLVQMRELAQDFSVSGVYGRLDDISRRKLRLLTQPIYRYEPTVGATKDGAIFAYTHDVLGTDPDALLVIEARQFEPDLRWEYAFARSHFTELSGYHRDVEVWKVENDWPETKQHVFGDGPGREKVYYSVERRP
jgi:hypothetical protein